MSTNPTQPDNSASIIVQCSCGKRLAALPQHAGKRLKCPACGQAVVVPGALRAAVTPAAPPLEEEVEGFSKTTLIAMWTAVGAFALGCILFLVWYSDSTHQAKIAAANDRISKAVNAANEWMTGNSPEYGDAIERQLTGALASELATDKANGETVLGQVRQRREQLAEQARIEQAQRQATAVFNDAKRQIDIKRITEAIILLREYIADPYATEKGEAQRLLAEAETAVSDKLTLDALVAMSDDAFDRAQTAGTIDDGKVTLPALLAVRREAIQRNLDEASQRREAERVAALDGKREEEKRRHAEDPWKQAQEWVRAASEANADAVMLRNQVPEPKLAEARKPEQPEKSTPKTGAERLLTSDWLRRAEESLNRAEPKWPHAEVEAKPAPLGDPNVWHVKEGAEDVFVAVSEKVHERLMQLSQVNDRDGVAQLLAARLVFMVRGGTKVRQIQSKGFFRSVFEVRILEGRHAGRSGWVLAGNLAWDWGEASKPKQAEKSIPNTGAEELAFLHLGRPVRKDDAIVRRFDALIRKVQAKCAPIDDEGVAALTRTLHTQLEKNGVDVSVLQLLEWLEKSAPERHFGPWKFEDVALAFGGMAISDELRKGELRKVHMYVRAMLEELAGM